MPDAMTGLTEEFQCQEAREGVRGRGLGFAGFAWGGLACVTLLALAYGFRVSRSEPPTGALADVIVEDLTKSLANSQFVTNAKYVKMFKFKPDSARNLTDAFKDAFPDEDSWWTTIFPASDQPEKTWYWQDVVYWAQDLLKYTSETFPDGEVPIPLASHKDDQLDPGTYVGYTRRQVCYLAAKALTGGELEGYDNGLTRYLSKEGPGGCLPRKGMFAKALFALLTACKADPTLEGGASGPMLFVVKHLRQGDPHGDISRLKEDSSTVSMSQGAFRLCRYDEGSAYKQGFLPGIPNSPKELCSQPDKGPGSDYLSTRVPKQAVVSSSGGKLYGGSCGTQGTLEDILMVFMPEVAVLSLFLSRSERPQLRAPAWVLGARMILTGLDGTRHWTDWRTNPHVEFRNDLSTVMLEGTQFMMSHSKPFLASAPAFQADFSNLKEARQNRDLAQRAADGPNAFQNQVLAWYHALNLDSLPKEFKNAMPKLVRSLGTGPWTSGFRFGDSQLDVLAIWLGQTLAAKSWHRTVFLDFYLYSAFTENPGNQCYLHSTKRCGACLWTCKSKWFPPGTFYVPSKNFFMSGDTSKPCVTFGESACSEHGIEDVFWNFGFKPANQLWTMLEKVLDKYKDQSHRSVFDRLYDEVLLEAQQKLEPSTKI